MSASEKAAVSLFHRVFGGRPDGGWQAPGRINLIGEHTDYNEGFVLPIAIDRTTTAVLRTRRDHEVHVASTYAEDVVTTRLDTLGPGRLAGWSAYPLGVAWALGGAATARRALPGFDLALASDVPIGAGLSSSAAIEIATAIALNETWQLGLDGTELARAGQRAENLAVGAPTGLMDQMASLFCTQDAAVFLDCRSLEVSTVPLGFTGAALGLLVIDTRVRHEHANGGYGARRLSCERGARRLGVRALRDVTIDALPDAERRLDPETFRRVTHVVTENARVRDAVTALRGDDVTLFSRLLTASHASMRDDFAISVPELDLAVDTAVAAGALGARMTGGGFGGAAIALIPLAVAALVQEQVSAAFDQAGFEKPEVFTVKASAGAGRVLTEADG